MSTDGARRDEVADGIGERAELTNRFAADVLDALLVWTIVTLATSQLVDGSSEHRAHVAVVVSSILHGLYQAVGVGIWGRTWGRAVMGVAVRRADESTRVGIPRAVLRWFVQSGSVFLWIPGTVAVQSLVSLAVLVSIFFSGERRGLHDHAAGTVVVGAPRAVRSWSRQAASSGPAAADRPKRTK